jgi:hypothetical protein
MITVFIYIVVLLGVFACISRSKRVRIIFHGVFEIVDAGRVCLFWGCRMAFVLVCDYIVFKHSRASSNAKRRIIFRRIINEDKAQLQVIQEGFLRAFDEAQAEMRAALTSIDDADATISHRPPRLAEYLLYFLPKAQRAPLMGDMEEVYGVLLKEQGKRRAQFWYWCQVLMAYKPLWSSTIVRRVAKWVAITGLGQFLGRIIPWEWVRRVLPVGEWIRRIIS